MYSEVRGKTGRKILKIYFSLSVSRVSQALSLLFLYTSPPSSAPGIASSCTTNTISCISHLFFQPLFFTVPCLPHLIFLLLTILASQGEGRRNSNCTAQHMCLCLGGNREGREEEETLPPLYYKAQLGGNREGREEMDTSPPPSLHI